MHPSEFTETSRAKRHERLKTSGCLLLSLAFLLPSAFAQGSGRRTPVVIAVEKAAPAVVNIFTEQETVRSLSPFPADPFFEEFFRDFFEPFRERYTQRSLGSGVIIRPEGYILTNEHVVVRATKIQVLLADERRFEARLVGADSDSDLAVLKIDAPGPLPYLPMGDSDDLMIGETVIAIGNPFGLSNTVSTGVVSALHRSLNAGGRTYYDFIQTDASINPGNSGGPLLNIAGELIGINTAIYGKAQGIGFAIPINRAKRIVRELIRYGEVQPPWIGLSVQDLSPNLAYHFSLRRGEGVLVREVERQSPAEAAGVRRGDVILAIENHRVHSTEEYWQRVRTYAAGDRIRFRVLQDGKEKTLPVRAARFPEAKIDGLAWKLIGVEVREGGEGLYISRVRRGSPAAEIGVEKGDRLLGLGGTPLRTLPEFRRKILDLRFSQGVLLSIGRGVRQYHVTIPLDRG